MTGHQKASVIASVAATRREAGMPALDEHTKDVLARSVGLLLDRGYDLSDIRYAACEIALAEASLWFLSVRVGEEFPLPNPS